ncbi:MAG: nitrate- and nitrite sensing domain-containing protein [Desulfurobacteriaceae bacterium]
MTLEKKLRKNFLFSFFALFVPVLVLAFLLITNAYKQYEEANSLEKSIILSTKISAVIHELQKERGRTAGFLGSGGKEFIEELRTQRTITDEKIRELKNFFDIRYLSSLPAKSQQIIKEVISTELNSLTEIRLKVDKQKISVKEAINFNLLNSIGMIAKYASDAKVSRELIAYTDLILVKEKMGLERAILSIAFTKDIFTKKLFEKFLYFKAEQLAFIRAFKLTAPEEVVKFYEKTLKGEAVDEVDRMERLALATPFTGNFNVDPNYWFNTITKKINLVKKVEDFVSQKLI